MIIKPKNCPYDGLDVCHMCPHHIADTDECTLAMTASAAGETVRSSSVAYHAPTYEERMERYESERKKLLALPKEALVDLILPRPTMFGINNYKEKN